LGAWIETLSSYLHPSGGMSRSLHWERGLKRFIAGSAQAHVVTQTTPGFNGGGASVDVATFGGALGDNMLLEAYNGAWYTVSTRNVTLG